MRKQTVTIKSPGGLHLVPCSMLVRAAMRFDSEIVIRNMTSGVEANAKSVLELMTLNAEYGVQLEIEASGDDEENAAEELATMIETDLG